MVMNPIFDDCPDPVAPTPVLDRPEVNHGRVWGTSEHHDAILKVKLILNQKIFRVSSHIKHTRFNHYPLAAKLLLHA